MHVYVDRERTERRRETASETRSTLDSLAHVKTSSTRHAGHQCKPLSAYSA